MQSGAGTKLGGRHISCEKKLWEALEPIPT